MKAEYSGDINYNGDDDTARIDITDSSELRVNITGYTDEYDGAEHEPYASLSVTGLGGIGVIGYDIGYIKKRTRTRLSPKARILAGTRKLTSKTYPTAENIGIR